MLLYNNVPDEARLVIILAASDNLKILGESSSWYLDATVPLNPLHNSWILVYLHYLRSSHKQRHLE